MKIKCFILSFILLCLLGFAGCNIINPSVTPDLMPHLIPQGEAFPDRSIDGRAEKEIAGMGKSAVINLYEAVTEGFKPKFKNNDGSSKPEIIYSAAIAILDRYILNSFSDFEKVHAIHDYLTYYCEYDFDLYNKYLNGEYTQAEIEANVAFSIEGVFLNKKAVCDGISQAFNFLCAIEGIDSRQIRGNFTSASMESAHAWNKVKIDGLWYNVDPTMDRAYYDDGKKLNQAINHGYFLLSDRTIRETRFGAHVSLPEYNLDEPEALTDYDFFKDMNFKVGNTEFASVVKTQTQLNDLFKAVKTAKRTVGKLEVKLDFGINSNTATAYHAQLNEAFNYIGDKDFKFQLGQEPYPIITYPNGVFVLLIYK